MEGRARARARKKVEVRLKTINVKHQNESYCKFKLKGNDGAGWGGKGWCEAAGHNHLLRVGRLARDAV
jgi:hypothetical protein